MGGVCKLTPSRLLMPGQSCAKRKGDPRMCGIAGHLSLSSEGRSPLSAPIAARMLEALQHRGPDGQGEWRAADGSCWLGHRRLAIIDLHTGDQPIANEDGSIWTI